MAQMADVIFDKLIFIHHVKWEVPKNSVAFL